MISMEKGNRLPWIDMMKAMGMYLIVLGHFFSLKCEFIYVFSVPLFFIISGFLCKDEEDNSVFWRKLWWNLIVPMFLICTINFLYSVVLSLMHGSFSIADVVKFLVNLILGEHYSLKNCWFVYTLILLKIIHQHVKKLQNQFILAIFFLTCAYILNNEDYCEFLTQLKGSSNAILNTCVSYPVFFIGSCCRRIRADFISINDKFILLGIFICGLFFVYLSGHYNPYVRMYICGYGTDIFWFIVGGCAGTLLVFAIAKLLSCDIYLIRIVSRGTILILGFHGHLIGLVRRFAPDPTIYDFLYAALIVFMFIPVIYFTEKYVPILLGKYRVAHRKTTK